VSLSWTNGSRDYDRIEVLRDGEVVAVLDGDATGHEDAGAGHGVHRYEVLAYREGIASGGAPACEVDLRIRFIRSDSNGDGDVDIADAIFVIRYLFVTGVEPPCLEAADSNDDARIDLSDAIRTLGFLFRGEEGPPGPYPGCGLDPDPAGGLPCAVAPVCP
jgi:hypothetical protein